MTYTEDLTNKPVERLKRAHRDLDAKKVQESQRKQEAFEDSKEVKEERERWAHEHQALKDANVNSSHIRGRLLVHERNIKILGEKFDNGELTPTTVHKSSPTDLEVAKEELAKAGKKIAELETELNKIKSDR